MKSLFYSLEVFLLLLCSVSALAQGIDVRGKVLDSGGNPLEGAVVMVKGTANGAMTSKDGSFSIRAGKDAVLEASMLGYATVEEPVLGRREISFTLSDDATMLESAVIEVGYGETRVLDLTGTVSRVNVDDIIKAPVVSLDQALQGRVAGMSVTSPDGQPGQEMNIVVRGANSLTQDNSPLYVVDGFALEDFSMSAISPSDIASVTVLKDASTTAIYGSRAAGGVVIIETKKGKVGDPVVTYTGNFGVHQVTKMIELMSPYEFVLYQTERGPSYFDQYMTSSGRTLEDYYDYKGIDWQKRMFRDAFVMDHNLSLRGGTSKSKYSVSLNAADQQGIIYNSGYEKYQARVSFDQNIRKNLKFGINGSYTHTAVNGQPAATQLGSSNGYAAYLMYRVWGYRPVFSGTATEEDLFDEDATSTAAIMNPVISNENEQTSKKTSNIMLNGRLDWTFAKDFKLSLRAGYNEKILRFEEFNNSKSFKGFPRVANSVGVNGAFSETRTMNLMNENTLSYNHTWVKKHKLNLMAGNTIQKTGRSVYGFTTSYIPTDELGLSGIDTGIPQSTTATLSENRLMSFFGRVNYSYDNRYLFTATLRADGSSKFAEGHQWGWFPSAAIAWRFSQEKWFNGVNWLTDGKLRLSYGSTGNNRVSDYASYSTMTLGEYYPAGGSPSTAIRQNTAGNKNLTWETTDQLDLGLEVKFFNARLSLTADLYRKDTRDLLLNAKIPYSSGFGTAYKNVGHIRNDGLELTIGATPVRTRRFMWTADFNIAFNRDKVVGLAEGQESLTSSLSWYSYFNNTPLYIAQLGGPVASFYGLVWDGVYQLSDFNVNSAGQYILKDDVTTNGDPRNSIQPGDIKYVDQNGDKVINESDYVVIGRCAPIFTGGFNNNFTYRNLSLNVFFQYSYGNQIMNANRMVFEGNLANRNINQYKSYTDHWTINNQDSKNFRVGGQGPIGYYSDRTIEDGSFLRLKTVQLSYSLPKRFVGRFGLGEVTLSISGQNLWTWTRYSGLDPEVSTKHSTLTPGFDYSSYARNRILTGGIKIVF